MKVLWPGKYEVEREYEDNYSVEDAGYCYAQGGAEGRRVDVFRKLSGRGGGPREEDEEEDESGGDGQQGLG